MKGLQGALEVAADKDGEVMEKKPVLGVWEEGRWGAGVGGVPGGGGSCAEAAEDEVAVVFSSFDVCGMSEAEEEGKAGVVEGAEGASQMSSGSRG